MEGLVGIPKSSAYYYYYYYYFSIEEIMKETISFIIYSEPKKLSIVTTIHMPYHRCLRSYDPIRRPTTENKYFDD